MFHFFADFSDIDKEAMTVHLRGDNYRHLKNVLRVRVGERVMVSDPDAVDYLCEVTEIVDSSDRDEMDKNQEDTSLNQEVKLSIISVEASHELPCDVYLFQGLPKSDKLELIIQKAVELGAHAIVPLETRNAVVKLDEKKAKSKLQRWAGISEAAAKQSKRSLIPEVLPVMKWKEAMDYVSDFSLCMIPYENAVDITRTMAELEKLQTAHAGEEKPKIAIFIGPEGGFTEAEIEDAEAHHVVPVTLGKRILRTETAAICSLSIVMLMLEALERKEK